MLRPAICISDISDLVQNPLRWKRSKIQNDVRSKLLHAHHFSVVAVLRRRRPHGSTNSADEQVVGAT